MIQQRPVLVLGAGGHAKVLVDLLQELNAKILGILDQDSTKSGQNILGAPVLGSDALLSQHEPKSVWLVNGLGSTESTLARKSLYEKTRSLGFEFPILVHPRAIVSKAATLMAGAQVFAGAIVQAGTTVGENAIINTGASIDHDCIIGAHSHIAPGSILSGNVKIEESVHIGTGTKIIQGIRIGASSIIGAGSVVIRSLPEASKALGVPAVALNKPGE